MAQREGDIHQRALGWDASRALRRAHGKEITIATTTRPGLMDWQVEEEEDAMPTPNKKRTSYCDIHHPHFVIFYRGPVMPLKAL